MVNRGAMARNKPSLWVLAGSLVLGQITFAQPLPVTAVTKNAAGQTGDAGSYLQDMSPDGQTIVFGGPATDLADGPALYPRLDDEFAVFVYDRATNTTTELAPAGADAQVSNDGRFVVFTSGSPDLVSGDTNGTDDVFALDRTTGLISLLSTNEFQNNGNGESRLLAMSGNGRHIAFASEADNLDLSNVLMRGRDLYVLDRDADDNGIYDEAGTLRPRRVVPASAQSDDPRRRFSAALSFDGRYLAFRANYRGITSDPLTGYAHLYFHDRDNDEDSIFDEPAQTAYYLLASDSHRRPSISDDGRYVAFSYYGNNAYALTVPGCESTPRCRLFVLDLDSDEDGILDPSAPAIRTALRPNLAPGEVNGSVYPSLSPSGRYLSYHQALPDANANVSAEESQVYLRDLVAGSERLVSASQTGHRANRRTFEDNYPSDDGRFVAFGTYASNLVPGDVNRRSDVFLFDASGVEPVRPSSGECDDLVDNDNDGLIDLGDSGCGSTEDRQEDNTATGVMRTIAVNESLPPLGSAIIVDAQGDTGYQPSLDIIFHGAKYIAYSARTYNPSLGVFEDWVKLARNYGVFWETEVLSTSGVNPSLAIDSIQHVHTAFFDPINQDLMYARNTVTIGDSLEVLESVGDTGRLPSLVVDSMDVPWIVYFDATRRQLRLRSPSADDSELLVGNVNICALDADITPRDRILIGYIDCDDRELIVIKANFSGGLEANDVVDFGPVQPQLTVASDAYGVGHVGYAVIGDEAEPIRYAYDGGIDWVIQRVPSDGRAAGLDLFMTLGIDANLVFSDQSGLRRIKFPQSFVFDQKPSIEVVVPGAIGDPADLSVALDPDDNLQVAYYDAKSQNLLQLDTTAAAWREHVVTDDPNASVGDLELVGALRNQTIAGQSPTLLTFTSEFPGGLGQLVSQQRFPIALDWLATPIAVAAPQDAADIAPSGRAVATFDNVNSQLRLYTEDPSGNWSGFPALTELPQFEYLDDIAVFDNGSFGELLISAVHRGQDGAGDTLTVFRGSGNSGLFTEHPAPFSVPSIVDAASAVHRGALYVAYLDEGEGELRLATFNGSWSDQLVDSGNNVVIGRSLSLQLTSEQLRDSRGQSAIVVPTIAYYDASNNQLRYASRVNGWEYFIYDQSIANIRTVRHVLDHDARQRPTILAAGSDGIIRLLRHTSPNEARLEMVSQQYDGSGEIDLDLGPNTAVAFPAGDGTVRYAIAGNPTALPAARARNTGGGGAPTGPWCEFVGREERIALTQLTASDATAKKSASVWAAGRSATPMFSDDEAVMGLWNEQFRRTAAGRSYVEFMRRDYPKMARIIAADPGLFFDATDALQNFMPGIRAMVDGNGDQAILTQSKIDAALDIWQRLADRDSGPLAAFIEAELARWNNLQDFVGMTYDEWGLAIGLDVSAVGGNDDLLFSDSFE